MGFLGGGASLLESGSECREKRMHAQHRANYLLQEMGMASTTGFPGEAWASIYLQMGQTSGEITWIQLSCFYSLLSPKQCL